MHNNTFGGSFYETEAVDQFVQLLELMGPELEELHQRERDQVTLSKRNFMFDHIVNAAHLLAPGTLQVPPTNGDLVSKKIQQKVDTPIKLVPDRITLRPNNSSVVRLYNQGTAELDLTEITWKSTDDLIKLARQDQGAATITAGAKTGVTKLFATGSFGIHEVTVVVSKGSAGAYIKGPGIIRPGNVEIYDLHNYNNAVEWRFAEGQIADIEVTVQDNTATKQVSVSVGSEVAISGVTLVAHEPKQPHSIVAIRKILISEEVGHKNTVIRINGVDYNLEKGFHYPSTLAQIDYLWNSDNTMPTIVFNPLHERVKKMGNIEALPHYLAAIAQTALAHQVESGLLKASEVALCAEEFILGMSAEYEKIAKEAAIANTIK